MTDTTAAHLDGHTVDGLTATAARSQLVTDGPNELPRPPEPSLLRRAVGHLVEPLAAILLVAAAASGFVLGHHGEAATIAAIVVLNCAIATAQESSAAAAMAALRSFDAPSARVRRDGRTAVIAAREVVCEDLLEVVAGDRVAADALVVDAVRLTVDESLLTGESMPVDRVAGDRLLAGTAVVGGHGSATVTATGPNTTMASIAAAISRGTEPPLVGELRRVAARMSVLAIALGAVLVPVVLVRSSHDAEPVVTAVLTGVALSIAALPEGLGTIVVGSLALGARRLARRGAIVRHVAAVDALGSTDVLCVDKTGTLTTGGVEVEGILAAPGRDDELWLAIARCRADGAAAADPLEAALVRAMPPAVLEATAGEERIDEAPFDPSARTMAVLVDSRHGPVLSVKGAPEAVLGRCRSTRSAGHLEARARELAASGRRVLAVAVGETGDLDAGGLEAVGLAIFHDPIRPSAASVVERCRAAGLRLVMVTGDHPATATAVAHAVGIVGPTITGADLVGLGPEDRAAALRSAAVVARVDPLLKVELVQSHRSTGAVVAMTGDGVNDAPALRRADVGVAVAGDDSTEVARQAASLVVTDGDLGTIVAAVAEGRRIRSNLRSVVGYLLAGNLSEVLVVAVALVALPELAVPLLPVQLLWCNLVTDGLPALALGVDEPAADPLARPTAGSDRSLLDRTHLSKLVVRACVMAATVIGTALVARWQGASPASTRTQMLLSLVVVHVLTAYAVRARHSTFERGWWRSRLLLAAIVGSVLLQVPAFTTPIGRSLLGLAAIPSWGWVSAAAAGLTAVLGIDAIRGRWSHGRVPEGPADRASQPAR